MYNTTNIKKPPDIYENTLAALRYPNRFNTSPTIKAITFIKKR